MDKVKIKRAKRSKKQITVKEKALAALGLGSSLMGAAGAVAPKTPETRFVRTQSKNEAGAASKIKQTLKNIFGINQAKAEVTDAYLQELADAVNEAKQTLADFNDWVDKATADADLYGTEEEKQARLQEIQATINAEKPSLVSAVEDAERAYSEAADQYIAEQNQGGGQPTTTDPGTGGGQPGGNTGGGGTGGGGGQPGGNVDPGSGGGQPGGDPGAGGGTITYSIDDFTVGEPQYDYAAIQRATTVDEVNNAASAALGQISTWKNQEMLRLGTWYSQQNLKVTQHPELSGELSSAYNSATTLINQNEQSARGQVTTLQTSRLAEFNPVQPGGNPGQTGPTEGQERANPLGYTEVYYQGNWIVKNGETVSGEKIGKETGINYGSQGGQWILLDNQTIKRDAFDYGSMGGQWILKNDQYKTENGKTYKSIGGVWVEQVAAPKEGDTRMQGGVEQIFQNGQWVNKQTTPTAPKNGDSRVENGVAQIYQNGQWYNANTPMALGFTPTAGATATIDGVKWEVKNGAWVVAETSTPIPTTGGTVTLTVAGGTLSDAKVGQQWTLVIKGAKGDSVYAKGGPNGQQNGPTLLGTISNTGELRLTGTFSAADVGSWQQTYLVMRNGQEYEIGDANFKVSAAGTQAGSVNLTVTGGTLSDAKVGQPWTLTIKGAPGSKVYTTGGKNGENNRYTEAGWVIPASGTLTLTGTFSAGDVGSWQQGYIVVDPATGAETQVGSSNFNVSQAPAGTLSSNLAGRFHAMGLLQKDDGMGNYSTVPIVYVAQNTGDGGYIYGLDYEGAKMVQEWMKANGYPDAQIVEQKREGNFTAPIYYISIPGKGEFLAGGIANEIIREGEVAAKQMISAEVSKGAGTMADQFQAVTSGTSGLLQVTPQTQVWTATPSGRAQVGTGVQDFQNLVTAADTKGAQNLGSTTQAPTNLGSVPSGTYTPTQNPIPNSPTSPATNPGDTWTNSPIVYGQNLSQVSTSQVIITNVAAYDTQGQASQNKLGVGYRVEIGGQGLGVYNRFGVVVNNTEYQITQAVITGNKITLTIPTTLPSTITENAPVQIKVYTSTQGVKQGLLPTIFLFARPASSTGGGAGGGNGGVETGVTELTLSASSVSVAAGSVATVSASAKIQGVTNYQMQATSGDTAVALVQVNSTTGVISIYGVSAGTTTVRVHPSALGSDTSKDKIISVTVTGSQGSGEEEETDVDTDTGTGTGGGGTGDGGTGGGTGTGGGGTGGGTGTGGGGTGGTGGGGAGTSSADIINQLNNQINTLQNQINDLNNRLANQSGNMSSAELAAANRQIADLRQQVAGLTAALINSQRGGGGGVTYVTQTTPAFQGLQMPAGYPTSGGGLQMPSGMSAVQGVETSQGTYTVKKGDTLWAIAKKYYGDGRQWRKILAANPACLSRPGNTRTLRIGYQLVIPK